MNNIRKVIDNFTINRKTLGAFYTPTVLADYLARETMSLSTLDEDNSYTIFDPAMGEGSLLLSCVSYATKKNLSVNIGGIDIDNVAIGKSNITFKAYPIDYSFYNCDALYPFDHMNSVKGWERLLNQHCPNGIDFIVCNPPWGADKSKYKNLSIDFETAKGQFDTYDLFIELCIRNLKENGCYGFIVPDSIFNIEHKAIRKYLFCNSIIKRIVRLGEGIFPNINTSVSLIFGIKAKKKNYKVECAHLSNNIQKAVMRNEISLQEAVASSLNKVSVKYMTADFEFLTEIKDADINISKMLQKCPKIKDYTTSHRGVELSKKGIVLRCPNCKKWFPEPKNKNSVLVKCPHCKNLIERKYIYKEIAISENEKPDMTRIIVGEDIFRYRTRCKSYIQLGLNGINYKDNKLYEGNKILIRKTGVGITAGIDYNNCMTNQVVYILHRKKDVNPIITDEVILAILNSRIITYYLIKTKGDKGWRTHPYLSQGDIASLPFPKVNNDDKTKENLKRITTLVKEYYNYTDFPPNVDAEIELLVSKLFKIEKDCYDTIFSTIQEAQQMIPFKRLLKITKKEIFKDGI